MGDRRDAPGGADGAAVFKQPYAESVFPVLLPLLHEGGRDQCGEKAVGRAFRPDQLF